MIPSRQQLAIVLALFVSGCSLGGDGGWGPLAVLESDGYDLARTEGTIRITDTCVLLENGDEVALLIWPADRTRWNASDGTIEFETLSGRTVTLASGQRVALGGGGWSAAEASNPDHEALLAGIDWISAPDPACPTDTWWGVGEFL